MIFFMPTGVLPPMFWEGALWAMLASVLVFLTMIDLCQQRLPDGLLAAFALISCILRGLSATVLSFYGIFILLLLGSGLRSIHRFWQKEPGLGQGDVKFLALAGLWVSWTEIPLFLTAVGALGIVWGWIWQKARGVRHFPLGPVIVVVIGMWIYTRGWR